MVLTGIETRCGALLFTSKFDSGNLARVERVFKEDDDAGAAVVSYTGDPRVDLEFNVWTRPDCSGTPFENGNRSWFYFGVRGGTPGRVIKINIMNMNRQGKLYSQGHSPIVKTVPGRPKWERIRDRPSHETVDGNFVLSFTHRFLEYKGSTTYFAFCFPWSYEEQQNHLKSLDAKFEHCRKLTPQSAPDTIYYHRELLCHSLDAYRIDLLTISSCHGLQKEEEERFDAKLFPDKETSRCKKFQNKRVYLVSSRVHPGETPASYVFNGFLDFILDPNDVRAKQLRRQYVFKLIPILNPDGVVRGHYRTDARGVNLNRMYLDPCFELFPSIYASKSLLVYHHVHNRLFQNTAKSVNKSNCASDMQNKENTTLRKQSSNLKGQGDGEGHGKKTFAESAALTALNKLDPVHSSNDLQSGGEFGDLDDDTEHLGNEGSEDEGANDHLLTGGVNAPHLSDPELLQIKPNESGIAMYVDLHGHASKRGCFIYGNYFEQEDMQAENMLFPKLISMNTPHFDFTGCNFTERNMYMKDKREGLSKEGAGRVAVFKAIGIIRSYTLECNYNTGRIMNSIPQASGDGGRATPPPLAGFPPKYTQAHFEEVGKAMAIAGLDITETNPWSRLHHSEYVSLNGLREWLKRYVRSLRGMGRGPSNASRAMRAAAKASGPSGGPLVPRVAFLARNSSQAASSESSHSFPGSTFTQQPTTHRNVAFGRRVSSNNLSAGGSKKELGPVREPPKAAVDRNRRRYSQPIPNTITHKSPSGSLSASLPKETPQSTSAPVTFTFTNASEPKAPMLEESGRSSVFSQRSRRGGRGQILSTRESPSMSTPKRMTPSYHVPLVTPALVSELQDIAQQLKSEASSTHSIEEEKFEQLKHISHRAAPPKPTARSTKPLEPPRSDPVKRRSKRSMSKRRSASHSPQSAKLTSRTEPTSMAVISNAVGDAKPRPRRRKSSNRPKSKTNSTNTPESNAITADLIKGEEMPDDTHASDLDSALLQGEDLPDDPPPILTPKHPTTLQSQRAQSSSQQAVDNGGKKNSRYHRTFVQQRLLSTLEVGSSLKESCLRTASALIPLLTSHSSRPAENTDDKPTPKNAF